MPQHASLDDVTSRHQGCTHAKSFLSESFSCDGSYDELTVNEAETPCIVMRTDAPIVNRETDLRWLQFQAAAIRFHQVSQRCCLLDAKSHCGAVLVRHIQQEV